eukprot:2397313-Rhodomonas_salina.4
MLIWTERYTATTGPYADTGSSTERRQIRTEVPFDSERSRAGSSIPYLSIAHSIAPYAVSVSHSP